ncbi:hypothetical protein KFE25_002517 [Diacronema lutheri]|mgnify:CR=1 FL=1|uniref:Uncharacterized protein n=1 Tax=Diacronema lutheri TaxID=2081491 RepID=A0A8J6C6L7_DIALT|nr:hypothetical protein KFE25_002517 [Diacronema lutheri]
MWLRGTLLAACALVGHAGQAGGRLGAGRSIARWPRALSARSPGLVVDVRALTMSDGGSRVGATADTFAESVVEYAVEVEVVESRDVAPVDVELVRAKRASAGRYIDAQPIKDDVDGLIAVGSAALGDAVDEVGEIADALARKLIDFKDSDGAREAASHLGTASEAVAELLNIAQIVADSLTNKTSSSALTTSRFRPPGSRITEAITNAATAMFLSSVRALAVVLRDVVLAPEVSEHALKAVRDTAKAAGAFGRAALQRLDGGAAERERKAARERQRRAPEGDVVDAQWVQKRPGAFGGVEIVDSSRKRRRNQQRASAFGARMTVPDAESAPPRASRPGDNAP